MPSTSSYKISAISSTENVMKNSTFGDVPQGAAFGDAARTSIKCMKKLGKGEAEFPLSDDALPTRGDKFVGTVKAFEKGAACLGFGIGNATMLIPDLFIGHGRVRDLEDSSASTTTTISNQKGTSTVETTSTSAHSASNAGNILDKGLLGHGLEAVVTGASLVGELGGAVVGGTLGVVSLPGGIASDKGAGTWIRSGAQKGGHIGALGVSQGVGVPTGLALSVARLPSTVVKYTLAGTMAVAALPVSLAAGTVRAIINK